MPVTLSEIARIVGRSKTQVSHALNGRGRVSPQLVKEVRRVARRHGYVPHGPARALERIRHLRHGRKGGRGVYTRA